MSELIVTWILWAIISFTGPAYDTVQVLDEFPENNDCVEVAKQVAMNVEKDINDKKIVNVDVTLGCIPIIEIKNPENINGSGLIPKPKTRDKGLQIG